MGCTNSKKNGLVTNETKPYNKKRQNRWRIVVGFEAKGLEFNVQFGMVHTNDETYDTKTSVVEASSATNTVKVPVIDLKEDTIDNNLVS